MTAQRREKLLQQPIPTYSKGEEIFNCVSHLVGIIFGIGVLIYFSCYLASHHTALLPLISLLVYSITVILLYGISTLYHFMSPLSPYKRIFRLIDHNTIYFLIVGTYFACCSLGFSNTTDYYVIMSIELFCLVLGCILNFANMHNKWIQFLATILYVVMGWCIICFVNAIKMLPFNAFLFILLGGISYTIGSICYAIGKKKKWMHSIFHLFVLLGTILQFVGILFLM